ncbi:MAG: 50S ribosomal protein L17 [Puniceicoccales bacterium]|jgi:large subunit ribosomal protein L17|nr:50S ribosomal protein L17 [Puniceicoccales bacterium]
MRHKVQQFQLGVKKEHRSAMVAGLAAALLRHGRIRTTLTRAKALRPFVEKIITLACHAAKSSIPERKLHLRRMAVARVRDQAAVKKLFDELVGEFLERPGGYTRIYKLLPRKGDGGKMALIDLVKADDKGYRRRPRQRSHRAAQRQVGKIAESEVGDAAGSTKS